MSGINRAKLKELLSLETQHFIKNHPRSKALFEEAKSYLLGGVPMNWMTKWASPYPIFMKEASGAHIVDVDGNKYLDFCLGDTGAMVGHSPEKSIKILKKQADQGITLMCPTEDAIKVGADLSRRFGLPYWQIATTATDANRFSIRIAREITRRKKILVYNHCYHGTVDETLISINDGKPGSRPNNVGPAIDPSVTTKVIEFNDIPALEAALETEDVACVLAEPAMTNIGIIHPDPGYHDALRDITRRTCTLLIIDETHTICSGPGGYTKTHGLDTDILTIGKPIASGLPAAAYGMSEKVAELATKYCDSDIGIGGTLSGNALSLAAIRGTLEHVLTDAAYEHTIPLATRFTEGVASVIKEKDLPWNVTQLGCRTEYWFRKEPARNGAEAAAAVDHELDQYMHLAAMNRGILMTPFHNMALIAPQVTEEDIDLHTEVFQECVEALLSE